MESEKKRNKKICLNSGFIGLAVPLSLWGIFLILNSFKINFGDNPFTYSLLIAISIIELPTVAIGRSIGLPIENGGVAFFLYDFNVLGYILTIIIWTLIGALIGWSIDKIRSRKTVSK